MSQLTLVFPKHAALLSPDEIYEKVDQELLAVFKEVRRLERKPAGTHFDALGDYFAMWANTLPEGGLLVVGMENDGSFSCHRLSQNQLNEIEKCHQTFCPDASVESKWVPVAASDGTESFVIVFRVRYREDKVATTVAGRAFTPRSPFSG
jgi:ATP-dependent DNA helicase RecG